MANTYEAIKGPPSASVTRHKWTFDDNGIGQEVQWNAGPATVAWDLASDFGGSGLIWIEWSADDGASWCRIDTRITSSSFSKHLILGVGLVRPNLTAATSPDIRLFLV